MLTMLFGKEFEAFDAIDLGRCLIAELGLDIDTDHLIDLVYEASKNGLEPDKPTNILDVLKITPAESKKLMVLGKKNGIKRTLGEVIFCAEC
jgi:hypothetical protein